MYSLMNPLCWSRSTLINSHEQIPLFSQCCLDKLQFHLTLDSNFNSFHRTTVNTSLGIQWLNCKARSVSQLPPHAHRASPSPHAPSPTDPLCFKSQFILSHLRPACGKNQRIKTDSSLQFVVVELFVWMILTCTLKIMNVLKWIYLPSVTYWFRFMSIHRHSGYFYMLYKY